MTEVDFRARAEAQGFPEPNPVARPPLLLNDSHTHDFTAFILVLEGEYTVTTEAGATSYEPGETYTLPAGTAHTEVAGPQGAQLLIARK